MLAIILNEPVDSEHVRLRTLSVVGSVLMFRMAHATAMAHLGWEVIGERECDGNPRYGSRVDKFYRERKTKINARIPAGSIHIVARAPRPSTRSLQTLVSKRLKSLRVRLSALTRSTAYCSAAGVPPPSKTPLPDTLPPFASGLGALGGVERPWAMVCPWAVSPPHRLLLRVSSAQSFAAWSYKFGGVPGASCAGAGPSCSLALSPREIPGRSRKRSRTGRGLELRRAIQPTQSLFSWVFPAS